MIQQLGPVLPPHMSVKSIVPEKLSGSQKCHDHCDQPARTKMAAVCDGATGMAVALNNE
jgi:hypothetical protein